jgi:hypothetical protein
MEETWEKLKEYNRQKKLENEKKSIKILKDKGFEIKILNEYTSHYRIKDFDFWPTTGKFYNQSTGEKGRGVFNLIKKIK